ncbi:ferritin-like domain-containing protein [uncultured Friedmanniella sp.]|uniref:ferritin-like domain-containing protein n=1 Tax=uncultured Friedmanniella sp. TaxID=335381 RepID=UPI0035CBD5EC
MNEQNIPSAPVDESDPARRVFGGSPVMTFADEGQRRKFLRAAAVVGFGSTLVALSQHDKLALADASANDLEILNYALTLEYLEADFYTRGVKGGALSGRDLDLVTPIRDHEQEHVTVLTHTVKSLGGKPAAKPTFKYPDGTFTSKKKFLTTASAFEELGVTAYHGQVARVNDGDILAAAASIAGVESRHAAVVADLLGGNPFPASFEKHNTMKTVLKAAGQFIKS